MTYYKRESHWSMGYKSEKRHQGEKIHLENEIMRSNVQKSCDCKRYWKVGLKKEKSVY